MRRKIHATKLFVTLVPVILIGSQSVSAAPPLRFTDLPGVNDMFLPPPPPQHMPDWNTWEPSPQLIPEIVVTEPLPGVPPSPYATIPPVQITEPTPADPAPIPPEQPQAPVYTDPAQEQPQAPVYADPVPEAPPQAPVYADPVPEAPPLSRLGDISGHWAEQAITYAYNRGLVFIPEDGVFRPNQTITRGEFAFMLDRWITANYAQLYGLGFTYTGANLTVLGVPDDHSFRHSITSLAFMGMVGGDAPFMPDEYVQRQEISRILLNLFLRLPYSDFDAVYFTGLNTEGILSRFHDQNLIAVWARDSVAVMADRRFMGADTDTFRPVDPLTRAEAYVTFYNVERWLRTISFSY